MMLKHKDKGLYERLMKRPMDFLLSGVAIIVLSPILGISAILIRMKLGSPVFFKQARPGKNEKIFYLYKFRSMTNAVDKDGKLLPDKDRLTKFGQILRKTSIDELPELINILKGDMSIVGPRPLSIYYLPHYSGDAKRRHDVRPGLTGLAQVNGRNNLPWDERFSLDVKYVENVTFLGDVKIIIDTFLKVIKAADISVRGTTKVYDFGTYKKIQEEGGSVVNKYDTTYSEIGSYFWLSKNDMISDKNRVTFLPKTEDSSFTFSGRTAIEIALRDAMKNKTIRKAYVPSYCCVSMLQSFIDNGIKYEFYEVSIENGKIKYEIDAHKECDLILFMRYFSMECCDENKALSVMKSRGVVVVEDITHSLLSEMPYLGVSDYLVASLRKWFAIPTGGWVAKTTGNLEIKPNIDSNSTVSEKIDGMDMKNRYMSGEKVSKEEFLKINASFDNDLIHVDRMLKLDDMSLAILGNLNIEDIKSQRRKNATMIKNLLSDIEEITLPDIDLLKETPLFYPVFLRTEDRDLLRKYLIENGMYCPVHWPEVMGANAGIRANELSLICDQRYTEKDMIALCECIHEWFKSQRG